MAKGWGMPLKIVCLFVLEFYGPVNNEVMSPLKIGFKEQRKKQQCDAFENKLFILN